jgi:hypothetical protein
MSTNNVIFTRDLFKEDFQKNLNGMFRNLIDAFGKRVTVARRYADHEEYHIWRGEMHDPQMEKRVQFSFGVSNNLHMGGLLRSIPFVEPDVAAREPYDVLGPASPSSALVKARPAVPELVAPDVAPYSFGIFDVRKPDSLLNLMKIEREQFAREVPKDVLFDEKPVLVVVEQNWYMKFIPRVVAPKSELFKIFSAFADHTRELAVDGRIFSISAI